MKKWIFIFSICLLFLTLGWTYTPDKYWFTREIGGKNNAWRWAAEVSTFLDDFTEKCVIKTQTTIATANLFAVAGGPIKVVELCGYVTNTIETKTNNIKLLVDPTAPATDTDLCAALDISAAAIGSALTLDPNFADAMVKTANGVVAGTVLAGTDLDDQHSHRGFICPIGMIELNGSASNTGTIIWYLRYKPLAPGVTVTAQ